MKARAQTDRRKRQRSKRSVRGKSWRWQSHASLRSKVQATRRMPPKGVEPLFSFKITPRRARRTGPQALFVGSLAQKRSFFDKLSPALSQKRESAGLLPLFLHGAVLSGRNAFIFFEFAGKIRLVGVANALHNGLNGQSGGSQQALALLKALTVDVLHQGNTCLFLKITGEIRGRKTQALGNGGKRKRGRGIIFLHIVINRAQQAAAQLRRALLVQGIGQQDTEFVQVLLEHLP